MSHPFYRYSTSFSLFSAAVTLASTPFSWMNRQGLRSPAMLGQRCSEGGAGTPNAPFKICTRAYLAAIAGAYLDRYFIQYENIDLGGAAFPWTPIVSFTGQYAALSDHVRKQPD